MPDTAPLIDDLTQQLIDAQQAARAELAAPEHKADLRKLADISNQMIALQADYDEIQARIGVRETAFQQREAALHAHLATKHGPPQAKEAP
jgi:hypothetical protein